MRAETWESERASYNIIQSTLKYIRTCKYVPGMCKYDMILGGFTLSDLLDKPWSQVSSLLPPRYVPSIFIAQRVQHSHCSDFHRMLPTHALALSATVIKFLCKKNSPQVCALGENWTREIDFSRHEDDLPSVHNNNARYEYEFTYVRIDYVCRLHTWSTTIFHF